MGNGALGIGSYPKSGHGSAVFLPIILGKGNGIAVSFFLLPSSFFYNYQTGSTYRLIVTCSFPEGTPEIQAQITCPFSSSTSQA